MRFDELKRGDVFTSTLRPYNTYMRMSIEVPAEYRGDPPNCCDVFSSEGFVFHDAELVTLAPMPDVPMVQPENYGSLLPRSVCQERTTTEYPWDGSDTEGSIGESVTRFYCLDAEMVRAWRRATSALSQSMARAADAEARERGYGAIGSGRR